MLTQSKPIEYLSDEEFEERRASNRRNHMTCRVTGTDNGYECAGYHCAYCGAGTGMMGHNGATYCRIRRASIMSPADLHFLEVQTDGRATVIVTHKPSGKSAEADEKITHWAREAALRSLYDELAKYSYE